jgi:hypothetical protein
VAAPTLGVYCASKFALEALADAYRFELAPSASILFSSNRDFTGHQLLEKYLLRPTMRVLPIMVRPPSMPIA